MSNIILVTGGSGMLGNHFNGMSNVVLLSKDDCDVTSRDQVKKVIKKYQPQTILHLAALTNVDKAEQVPELAYSINSMGTMNIASEAQASGSHLIYVSTAAVFSGKGNTPFKASDIPDPVNVYARSKFFGESMAQDICEKTSIVRTGWLFGGFEKDHKFVGMIARQVWDNAEVIKAVTGTKGCPTYTGDLQKVLMSLVEKQKTGIFHAVNKGSATRAHIAAEIISILGSSAKLEEAESASLLAFGAPRPHFEVIEQNIIMRPWEEALKEYLQQWQSIHQSQ